MHMNFDFLLEKVIWVHISLKVLLILSGASNSFVKLEKESLALSIHTYFLLVPIY